MQPGTSMELFADATAPVPMAAEAVLLPRFAADQEGGLAAAVEAVAGCCPFRHMHTPGGHRMSVAMTNCGAVGWISDERGYRYAPTDPVTGRGWAAMPAVFAHLARCAAERAGFAAFEPDACLLNRYEPGARMSLHQDRNERDLSQPIVSVSLGLPATFLFGGLRRGDRPVRLPLASGDVVVWGGRSRLAFHGVAPLAAGSHPRFGAVRINLTFRRAA